MNSTLNPATGKGRKGTYTWNLSSVVTSAAIANAGRLRLINNSTNGKKLWVPYAVGQATLP